MPQSTVVFYYISPRIPLFDTHHYPHQQLFRYQVLCFVSLPVVIVLINCIAAFLSFVVIGMAIL
jgi:hypothetical protein